MRLYFKVIWLSLFFINTVWAAPLPTKIFETNDITHILDQVDRNTLVIFNIDYTLFHSTTHLGSPEWSQYLLNKEMQIGNNNREEVLKSHHNTWVKAQQFSEIELMDLRIPKLIKDLKRKALGFIALTSRQGDSAEITRWQLGKFDLDFAKSSVAELNYASTFKHPGFYRDGILFAHKNEKGNVFLEWLQQARSQSSKLRSIQTVVFVDDSINSILSVAEACQRLGIEFVGYRYALGDNFKKRFNPKLVEAEKEILLSNHSDSETRLLLENAGSYAERLLIQQKR